MIHLMTGNVVNDERVTPEDKWIIAVFDNGLLYRIIHEDHVRFIDLPTEQKYFQNTECFYIHSANGNEIDGVVRKVFRKNFNKTTPGCTDKRSLRYKINRIFDYDDKIISLGHSLYTFESFNNENINKPNKKQIDFLSDLNQWLTDIVNHGQQRKEFETRKQCLDRCSHLIREEDMEWDKLYDFTLSDWKKVFKKAKCYAGRINKPYWQIKLFLKLYRLYGTYANYTSGFDIYVERNDLKVVYESNPVLYIELKGRRFRSDLSIPELKIAIDVNGSAHDIPSTSAADIEKRRLYQSVGWKYLTFHVSHLLKNDEWELYNLTKEIDKTIFDDNKTFEHRIYIYTEPDNQQYDQSDL